MGIEVRQLVVRSDVVEAPTGVVQKTVVDTAGGGSGATESIREEVLEECMEWLEERQSDAGER